VFNIDFAKFVPFVRYIEKYGGAIEVSTGKMTARYTLD
jgi:hypothetical protein